MPVPRKGETQKQFVSRCVPIRHGEHPKESNEQSVAVCFSIWKEHKKKSKASKEKDSK